jgi:TrpR-related protein YerC/YecD
MSHLNHLSNNLIDELFRGILTLENVDECYTFFSDLLTVQELATFAQRLQVAGLLAQGNTYEAIEKQVSVSSSTITRINTELHYGAGGYQMVLERLAKEKEEDTTEK